MSIELLVSIAIPILLIVVGRVIGSRIERAHYASIVEREAKYGARPAFSTKEWEAPGPIRSADLAVGSVVISVDHFKRFLSVFRMIVGGEIRSYSSLIDRARREAVLRMKESQPDAHAYLNTRLETSTVGTTSGNDGMGTIEVLAYATAVQYDRAS